MVRGRGYTSRGGGRGNSYRSSGSSYRGGSSRKDFNDSGYRGGNSRYNSTTSYNSYDSRSREKFPSRYENRSDTKRSYRDNSRDRSDDRKRPRQEDSRLSSNYAASSSSYRSRTDSNRNRASSPVSYQGRGSSASSYRRGTREDSASRRHTTNDSMGPPKRPVRSSYAVRPRGGSGTISRLRGSGASRGGMRVIRKEATDMRIMRRQLLLARQRDRARLIKIARLTSSLRKRKGPRSSTSPSGRSKSRGVDKKSDNEEEEKDEQLLDEDAIEGEVEEPKEKRVKKIKLSSSSAQKESAEGDDVNDEDEKEKDAEAEGESDKDEDEELDKPIKKEPSVANDEEGEEDEAKEGKKKAKSADGAADEVGKEKVSGSKDKKDRKANSKERSRGKRSRSPAHKWSSFIKLTCVHCRMNCVTFKEYHSHLYSRTHKMAMRRVAIRQRVTLARMRTQQRHAQRAIDEKYPEQNDAQFCMLCRLNYRQPKAKHQLSEHHKDMKKFLMPYCSTCHVAFKSPMIYEAHRCSLEHIRRKAHSNDNQSDVSGGEEKEVDLKDFLTVDSVGEIDDLDDEDLDKHLNEDPNQSSKEKVPVGAHFIKKVEAFYCELCRTYNSIKEDEEGYIRQHCSSRSHLKSFLRHREDENLLAKAERAEKKDIKSKNEEVDPNVTDKNEDGDEEEEEEKEVAEEAEDPEDPENPKDQEAEETEEMEEHEEVGEDKLWEDVDKDLGDLLREVGPEDHDGEEEEEDESVLNIDIESEKSKPNKEMNGKKEEQPAPTAATEPDVEEVNDKETEKEKEKPKKEPQSTPVVKLRKEKVEIRSTPVKQKAGPASSKKTAPVAKENRTESTTEKA